MRRLLHALTCALTCSFLLAVVLPASANISQWLSKAGKAGKAGSTRADLVPLTKQQVLAASASLGAGAIFVEVHGGKVLMELAGSGADVISGAVDDTASLATRLRGPHRSDKPGRFVLTRENASALGPALDQLMAHGEVFVVEPVLGPLRVGGYKVAGQAAYFKEVRQGLLAPIQAAFSVEVGKALTEPLRAEAIRVASMYATSEVEAFAKLAGAAGDRLLRAEAMASDKLARTLSQMRGGALLVVGHVEDAAFVARDARGELVHSIPFQELEALAQAAGVTVVSAGCSSFCSGARAGFGATVTDTQVAEAVRMMFQADSAASMLAAFGTRQPLILSQEALDGLADSRRLRLTQLQSGTRAVNGAVLSVRLSVAGRRPPLAEDFIQAVGATYLWGLLLSALMFRTSRAAFLRHFPRLPSAELPQQRPRHLAARVGRILLYLTAGPFAALIAGVVVLVGGWQWREDVQSGLWFTVRHPLRAARNVLRFLVSSLELLLVYGLALAVLSCVPVALSVWAFQTSGSPWFGLLTTCAFGAWSVALWTAWKGHKRFHARVTGLGLLHLKQPLIP